MSVRRRFGLIAFCFLGAVVAGCTDLNRSAELEAGLHSVGATCASNTGAYALPRRLVEVTVKQAVPGDVNAGFGLKVEEGKFVADGEETYCLDFLLSPFSNDRIGIAREGMLLERLYTRAEDQTADIARKLVAAAADLSANTRTPSTQRDSLVSDGTNDVLRFFEFDPMNQAELRKVNAGLRPFGYCLYISPTNDPFVPYWSGDMCRLHKTARHYELHDGGMSTIHDQPVPKEAQRRGILYRPELVHSMVVLRQDNPGNPRAPWYRAGSKRLTLPNVAPTFLLEAKRAWFVTSETNIEFHRGMVQNIHIDKPSELKVVSELTVEAVQIVKNIPRQVFKIFSNRAQNTQAVIDANQKLIETLESYNEVRGVKNRSRTEISPDADRLVLQRSGAQSEFTERNAPAVDTFSQCMSDPATQQYEDRASFCRTIAEE